MRICLAGEGAQGISHADVLQDIEGVEIVTLAGGIAADAEAFAYERGIPHWSLYLTNHSNERNLFFGDSTVVAN